jgi:phage minor structural protein
MLQLFDVNHNKIELLQNAKDIKLERELSGIETLSFSYPQSDNKCSLIKNEGFIRTKSNEYVIKEVNPNVNWTEVICRVNTDDLYGKQFDDFEVNDSLLNTVNLAIAGTGWTVGNCDVTKIRHIALKYKNAVDILKEITNIWLCDIWFDAINKKVNLYSEMGSDKGVYFIDELNLKELTVQGTSYDFITRLIPLGAKNLDITSVNNGLNYIDNHEYSSKIITGYWRTKQYTDPEALKDDSVYRLNVYSKPVVAYNAKIIDLANCSSSKYSILEYSLGDTITLIDNIKGIKDIVRIVKSTEYLLEPEKNEVQLNNRLQMLQDMNIQLMDAADSVDAVTNGDGSSIDGSTIDSVDFSQVQNVSIGNAEIQDASISTANIQDGAIVTAKIGDAQITQAKITDAAIGNAQIQNAAIGTANIQAESITTALIGTGAVDTEQVADGSITDAKIVSLTANKITAGTIDAGEIDVVNLHAVNITVGQINGNQIADGTIQSNNIAENAVEAVNIASGCISADKIAPGTITGDLIAAGTIKESQLNWSSHLMY